MQTTLVSAPYQPSSPVTGDERPVIFRGQNVILAGKLGQNYYRAYAGSYGIGETFTALAGTGTITFATNSLTITGSGTVFLNELHRGQLVFAANGEILEVDRIVSNTVFIAGRLPSTTVVVGQAITLPPRLEAMDVYRMALQWGNPILTDKGNILAVGQGVLYKNGSALSGSSLTATRSAQIAIYSSSSNNYSVKSLGFSVTPITANTDITVVGSGGTKNMSLGYYSFKIGYYSSVTEGYSDAGATLLSGGTTGYQVTVANSTINFDFTSDIANRPANSTGYVIYASAFTNSSDQSKINAIQGPWYEVRRVPYSSLSGADAIAFDFTDADLGTLVSFNNTFPPDADWISSLAGYVNLVSCYGQGVNSGSRGTSTSPGPFISPMKADNIDGYPASFAVPTEKGEDIIGQINVNGRLFVMTANSLQATTPTGLDSAPMTLRPFWKTGFSNPYNLIAVNDVLYGFTSKGMYRSIATGDSADATNDFASSVNAQMATWEPGYVYLAYDPKSRSICVFHTAAYKNSSNYWVTEVYVYNLDIYDWTPKIVLSSTTRDMIVSGVATVGGALYFIAGGRRNGTTDRWDTFAFDDARSGDAVDWYLAWNYTDAGSELTAKQIRKIRPKGRFTNASVQIYTVEPDDDVDISGLETGASSAFSYSLDNSTSTLHQYEIKKTRVRNALMYTARIAGTSTATGNDVDTCNQFQEIALDITVSGQER